jgi:hypothetical protein
MATMAISFHAGLMRQLIAVALIVLAGFAAIPARADTTGYRWHQVLAEAPWRKT